MKNQLSIVTLLSALVLFGAHVLASVQGWYVTESHFDKYMHFLGGVFIFFLLRMIQIPRQRNLFMTILFVVVVGLLWEVYEYVVQYYTGAPLATIPDSIDDIIFDTIGAGMGAIMIIFVRDRKKQYNTTNER